MKQRISERVGIFFLCVFITFMGFPITAKADVGPKPSIQIKFENMSDEMCYGTLLSESASAGRSSAWDGDEKHIDTGRFERDIWEAFVQYKDSDGYYFLQESWLCSESKRLDWTYSPPKSFKILLYYPETDTFVASGIYERYAFDSYFSVDMEGMDPNDAGTQTPVLIAKKSYNYAGEVMALIVRIVITILLEIGIAFLFGFREKRLLTLIACINVVTQIILNVRLNIINYNHGFLAFLVFYIRYEMIVFIIEAILYAILFPKVSTKHVPVWKPILYALAANVVSYISGFLIAVWIPEIF